MQCEAMLELLHHAFQGEFLADVLGVFEGDDVSAAGRRQEDPGGPRHMLLVQGARP